MPARGSRRSGRAGARRSRPRRARRRRGRWGSEAVGDVVGAAGGKERDLGLRAVEFAKRVHRAVAAEQHDAAVLVGTRCASSSSDASRAPRRVAPRSRSWRTAPSKTSRLPPTPLALPFAISIRCREDWERGSDVCVECEGGGHVGTLAFAVRLDSGASTKPHSGVARRLRCGHRTSQRSRARLDRHRLRLVASLRVFGFPALDVALGLAFLYLTLAFVCSSVNEAISTAFGMRARFLQLGLLNILSAAPSPTAEGKAALKKFYGHPLVQTMVRPNRGPDPAPDPTEPTSWWRRPPYPSYLASRTFVGDAPGPLPRYDHVARGGDSRGGGEGSRADEGRVRRARAHDRVDSEHDARGGTTRRLSLRRERRIAVPPCGGAVVRRRDGARIGRSKRRVLSCSSS